MNDYARTYVQRGDFLQEKALWGLFVDLNYLSLGLFLVGLIYFLSVKFLKEGNTGYHESNRWHYRISLALLFLGVLFFLTNLVMISSL